MLVLGAAERGRASSAGLGGWCGAAAVLPVAGTGADGDECATGVARAVSCDGHGCGQRTTGRTGDRHSKSKTRQGASHSRGRTRQQTGQVATPSRTWGRDGCGSPARRLLAVPVEPNGVGGGRDRNDLRRGRFGPIRPPHRAAGAGRNASGRESSVRHDDLQSRNLSRPAEPTAWPGNRSEKDTSSTCAPRPPWRSSRPS